MSLSKEEMLEAIKLGERVSHRHFTPDEWMEWDGAYFVFEDGIKCLESEFWHYRQDGFDDGWQVIPKMMDIRFTTIKTSEYGLPENVTVTVDAQSVANCRLFDDFIGINEFQLPPDLEAYFTNTKFCDPMLHGMLSQSNPSLIHLKLQALKIVAADGSDVEFGTGAGFVKFERQHWYAMVPVESLLTRKDII